MTPPFRPLTEAEHAALYAEMQRPAVPGYADELPEEPAGSFARGPLIALGVVAVVVGVVL